MDERCVCPICRSPKYWWYEGLFRKVEGPVCPCCHSWLRRREMAGAERREEEKAVEQNERIELEFEMSPEEYAALERLAASEKRPPADQVGILVRRELLALETIKETPDEVKVRGLCERRIINEWENGKIGPVAIKTMSGEYVKGGR